jgi:sugar/nucleoside kinase (ribokinase family)/D-arabinose 5-phosphate isomerase GutQ
VENQLDLAGIGSMVVDLIYRVPRIIRADEKLILEHHSDGDLLKRVVGGVTLNHLAWASLLGLRVGIFGKQADDELGRFLRDGMDRYRIERHITLDGSASSFASIFVDQSGARAIYMSPAATSQTTAKDIRTSHASFIRRARILSTEVSQLPLDAVVAALEIAKDAGALTILDLDVPRSDALKTLGTAADFDRALKTAEILKPSKAAAVELTGLSDTLAAARALKEKYSSRAVVITDGERGCAFSSDDVDCRVDAYSVGAIDTTGAGDAFLGGLIAGIHYELRWEDTLRLANACGAACCELTGATPDLTTSRRRVFELYDGKAFQAPDTFQISGKRSPYENSVEDFLRVSVEELNRLRRSIGIDHFKEVADLIERVEASGGRLHVTGIGKPEYVSGYISALLSSTGTPAYFLHGTECVHGSAGQVRPGDIVIVISNSGETGEMKAAVTALKRNGSLIIGISGDPKSWLASQSDEFLYAGVEREGSPLNFEPRASVLAEIYVLAALSVELQARKGITRNHYNAWHPGGTIGKVSGEQGED